MARLGVRPTGRGRPAAASATIPDLMKPRMVSRIATRRLLVGRLFSLRRRTPANDSLRNVVKNHESHQQHQHYESNLHHPFFQAQAEWQPEYTKHCFQKKHEN